MAMPISVAWKFTKQVAYSTALRLPKAGAASFNTTVSRSARSSNVSLACLGRRAP